MVPDIRKRFNAQFTQERYQAYLEECDKRYPGPIEFRIAETPLFIPQEFTQKMLAACESILDTVLQPEYRRQSEKSIPPHLRVPDEDLYPQCIVFDFGICEGAAGTLEPQLIEMQGFPSLFAWHLLLPEVAARHFELPEGYSPFLNGFDRTSYLELLRSILVGDSAQEQVILLELFPHQQKTKVDFYATEDLFGIRPVCLTDVYREGKDLYYNRDGRRTKIERIYNRVIFDELEQQPPEVREKGRLFGEELNVQWVPHPNWFYRLSKFSLPFIRHPFVPPTFFLNEVNPLPSDLHNYVVKPLFSFAGQGVIIDVTQEELDKIEDPQNWILQRKVTYAPVIETPGENAKAEIRLFYFWPPGADRPVAANNLARLSKGKMVGVRYNKDKEWVGGTFCLFQSPDR